MEKYVGWTSTLKKSMQTRGIININKKNQPQKQTSCLSKNVDNQFVEYFFLC